MVRRVAFSKENLDLSSISNHYADLKEALDEFYIKAHTRGTLSSKFFSYTEKELFEEHKSRVNELDKTTVFSLLSSLEALFRLDYLKRNYDRKKEPISVALRKIYKQKENRASLEEDILSAWKSYFPSDKLLLSEIIGAFKFRHWLAHGRYWTPKLDRKYDYSYVHNLYNEISGRLPILK